jgi:hypothetical protein
LRNPTAALPARTSPMRAVASARGSALVGFTARGAGHERRTRDKERGGGEQGERRDE